MHSVLKNLPMSIHVFFFWIQIYMATDFKSVCGRRSTIGHLIKTKAGKMFLQQSSKGENSTKREIKQNGILTKPLPSKIIWHVCFSFPETVFCQLQGNISMLFLSKSIFRNSFLQGNINTYMVFLFRIYQNRFLSTMYKET